jgi:LPXTG-site transpeptidase (sortase) family protein
MVGTWWASIRRAAMPFVLTWRSSIRPVLPIVGTWRLSIQRALPAELPNAFVLAALIGLIGAVSWRDGVPTPDSGVMGALLPRVVAAEVSAELPSFVRLPDVQDLASLASKSAGAVTSKLMPTSPPVQLLIPSINVHRPVEAVGANRFGYMDLPVNGWNAGWFKGSPVPGALGDAVIEGHAGYPDQPMIFARLVKLTAGDQIIVVLADGSRRLFLVSSTAVLPVGSAPPGMGQPGGPARLTLVTCAGRFDADNKSYSSRLVVEATYAGLA